MGIYIPIGVLLLLIFYPLTLKIHFFAGIKEEGRLKIFWYPLGTWVGLKIHVYQKKVDIEEKREKFLANYRHNLKKIWQMLDIIKAVEIKKLELDFSLGAEDAAATCLAAGGINIFFGTFFPLLDNKYKIFKNRPIWQVSPIFGYNQFSCRGECILTSSWGDIILRSISVFLKIRRNNNVRRKRNKIANGNSFGKP